MTSELIGMAVEIVIAQNDVASDDCFIRRKAHASFLQKMIEPLARSPMDFIACMLLYDTLTAAEAGEPVQIKLPLCEQVLERQLNDRLSSDMVGYCTQLASCCLRSLQNALP
jgi:hypothetical protein